VGAGAKNQSRIGLRETNSGRFGSVARAAMTSVAMATILRIPATLIFSAVSVGLW
jgi:hypothetical protein